MMLCTATLVVASLLSQLDPANRGKGPVDVDYRPRPGDLCMLGSPDRDEERAGRRARIDRAECYTSEANVRLAIELDMAGDESRVERGPESYRPRALTACEVRERRIIPITDGGKPSRTVAYRVIVMEGEFKDRLFWVAAPDLFRFKVPEG